MTFPQMEYCVRSGVNSFQKHKTVSLVTVIVMTACLFLISSVFLISFNISCNMKEFQRDNAMIAFVDDSLQKEDAKVLESEIEGLDGVTSAVFISREEAMEDYIEQYGEQHHLSASVFRNRYAVEISDKDDLEVISAAVKEIDGIADTRVDQTIVSGFESVKKAVDFILVSISAILLSIAVVITTNTIKLTIYARKEEIAVQHMMGAYTSFVKLPFIVEGCVVGILSALINVFLTSLSYGFVCKALSKTGILSLITLVGFKDFAWYIFSISMVLGITVGIVGSEIVVQKHLCQQDRKVTA